MHKVHILTPQCGWSRIMFGDNKNTNLLLTYAQTDVIGTLLNMIEEVLNGKEKAVSEFDTEGSYWKLTLKCNQVKILDPDGKRINVEIGIKDFAEGLFSDIKRDIGSWGIWECILTDDPSPKELQAKDRYQEQILEKIAKLEEMF